MRGVRERHPVISFILSSSTLCLDGGRSFTTYWNLENSHGQTGNRRSGAGGDGPESGAEHREPRPRGLRVQPHPRENRRTDRGVSRP
ncbi:hypothetical protein PSAB6_220048 [Paraburkholderia sabiae]|nr:hypothetical protein PSAB6_220048 [Paraburkholderia sabiae]